MDLATFDWLLSSPGQELLARAARADPDPLKAASALRGSASGDRIAAALTIARLRVKGVEKFGELAERMYFTPDGLEQSTRLPVATHRASRLRAAGAESVIDLGCGIGGDLIAFSRAGLVAAGVDQDALRVAMARANLAALGLGGAAQVADATSVEHAAFAVAYADPARRSGRGRSHRPDDWTPSWTFIETLFRRDSCVKVAPGIDHALIPEDVEGEWVSDHGELKEAALWSGRLASTRRRATVIGDGGLATLTDEDDPGAEVCDVGEFIYEPDPAVIRAGLVTAVAAGVGGGLLDEHIAYVTADRSFRTPFARGYRVTEEVPYREKALKAALRERHIGTLEIKKRGVQVVPSELRNRLALKGDESATLIMTRVSGKGRAFLARPF